MPSIYMAVKAQYTRLKCCDVRNLLFLNNVYWPFLFISHVLMALLRHLANTKCILSIYSKEDNGGLGWIIYTLWLAHNNYSYSLIGLLGLIVGSFMSLQHLMSYLLINIFESRQWRFGVNLLHTLASTQELSLKFNWLGWFSCWDKMCCKI